MAVYTTKAQLATLAKLDAAKDKAEGADGSARVCSRQTIREGNTMLKALSFAAEMLGISTFFLAIIALVELANLAMGG